MSKKPVCWLFLHGFFIGCRNQMRYVEIGAHAKECRHKPSSDLDSVVSVMHLQFHCISICFSSVMFVFVQIYTFGYSVMLLMKSFVSLQEVTQTNWYRKYFASSNNLEITTNHTLEVWTGHVCGHTKDINQTANRKCPLIFD